ncbi:putative TetR family transcriptional regulator [Gordonia araii NBRC 100433]|uniref:Putative TetR family transcriptional regulator n=1 Tax=Gordonia araii NBRC 100433 TaxID=1073574 RepID=G7H6I4_9ACTN|nr:TetR/AcrR family transcriptional regulator [Gordonia araii]NNG96139.1 TetR/AcrR family transcriptional regulator [Gordonia araii NBRC 100433]GAB11459.1 putative TetR family transcriptional regulator [Gordonia araii NBRC 100433]
MSIRNADSPESSRDEPADELSTRVLDAAREEILRQQGRKVSLADVARAAGVSRPTVYRRWASLDEVVRDLCHREINRIVEAVQATTPLRTRSGFAPEIDQIVRVAGAIRDDELFAELWRGQPDFLQPYVFDRLGSSQRSLLRLLADGIEQGQADGWVRDGDPDKLAAMVLLITQSAVQSQALVEPILGEDWSTELHRALASYLEQPGKE